MALGGAEGNAKRYKYVEKEFIICPVCAGCAV